MNCFNLPNRLLDFLSENGFAERVETMARTDLANTWDANGVIRPWNKYLQQYVNHTDSGSLITLIGDYLAQLHLDNTLDVFMTETGTNGIDVRPPVRATTRLVQELPRKDELLDTPIDAMVQSYRGDIVDGCPDLLLRLKQRLNVPDYNECIRGAGADPGQIQKVLHQSMYIKKKRDDNERSLRNRPMPEWLGDSKVEDLSFWRMRNKLQSTGDQLGQSFWEHELSGQGGECEAPIVNHGTFVGGAAVNNATFVGGAVNNATFDGGAVNNATFDGCDANNATFDGGAAANNATFDGGAVNNATFEGQADNIDCAEEVAVAGPVECDPLAKYRTLPGGVLDLMAVGESEHGFSSVPLSVNRLEDLKEALSIDERADLEVNSLGPNIIVKQLECSFMNNEFEMADVSVELYADELHWLPTHGAVQETTYEDSEIFDLPSPPASPVRPRTIPTYKIKPTLARPPMPKWKRPRSMEEMLSIGEADEDRLSSSYSDEECPAPPPAQSPERPAPRARIVKPEPKPAPAPVRTGAIPKKPAAKKASKPTKKRPTSQPGPSGIPASKPVSRNNVSTVQNNYKATPAVITAVIQASLENALNAVYDPNVSQEGAAGGACGVVDADVVATYSVPANEPSEQAVKKVLCGKVCKPPKKIKLVLKTPQGTEEPIDIPVAGQKSKLQKPKSRSRDGSKLQVPEENLQENVMMDLKFAVEISEERGQRVVRPTGESKKTCRRKTKPASSSRERRQGSGSSERRQNAPSKAPSARDRMLAYSSSISGGGRRAAAEVPQIEVAEPEPECEVQESVYDRGSLRMRIPVPWSCYDDGLESVQEGRELLFPGQKRTVRPKPPVASTGASRRQLVPAAPEPRPSSRQQRVAAAEKTSVQRQLVVRQAATPVSSPLRARKVIGPELGPRPKIRLESRRPLVQPVQQPVIKKAPIRPLVDPSQRAAALRARSLENLRVRQKMEAAPKLPPRQVSDIRRRGGCTTAQPKLPDDFRLGQRVIPVKAPDARATKRIVLEDVRLAMEAPPQVAPRAVSKERRMFGCSTAQPAPSNDFRLGQRVIPTELPSIEQRLSREEVRRAMESAPTVTPREVSDHRRLGGSSLAEGVVPDGWRSSRAEPPPPLAAPPPRIDQAVVHDMMVAEPKLAPRECSAPRMVFGCSTAKPFKRESTKRWR